MDYPLVVSCVSGGMDSCVTLALLREQGYQVAALHVTYGQKTSRKELECFREICSYYSIEKSMVVDISHLARIGGSSLTDQTMEVPDAYPLPPERGTWRADGDDTQPSIAPTREIPNTYVPFRNANILSIAVSWAEVLGASGVAMGAVEEDSSGYPDCRRSFFESFEAMVEQGTKPDTKILVLTPVIAMSKSMIVQEGIRLAAPLHATWSCYREMEQACGTCDSCQLRLKGFRLAGAFDPIPYQGITT